VLVGSQVVDEWTASLTVPSAKLDSTSSTRRTVSAVALRSGDQIRIEGIPDRGETAALDYVEVVPAVQRSPAAERK
jgi:hypothetical protein